jgi:Ca2+-binding EF-hand superfamily protein
MHGSPEFRSLKAKIRVLCKQRRIRLEEFMKTFDIHRVKKIKVEQFKRALDVSGLQLSPSEVSTLLAKYRLPDDPSFVDYRRFCDLIDKVFTVKGLEIEMPIQTRFTPAPVSGQEEEVLTRVKSKLLAAVTTKGVVLKDVFRDFDRSNAGKVTKTQFVRDLLDIVELSANELTVLLKVYSDDLDVYYRAIHFDICPATAGAEPQAAIPRSPERRHFSAPATSGYGTSGAGGGNAVRELEASLSEIATRDRIRTKSFFIDFDPLRTGKCTEAQFRRCVKLCFSFVSESDLDGLVSKYAVKSLDTTKVDYIQFCQCIDGQNASRGSCTVDNNVSANAQEAHDDILETLAAVTFSHGSGPRCTREVRGTLSDSEQEIHRAMMQRLNVFCSTRRVLLKPSFQDFDRGRREHITVEQFFRGMAMFKLTLASDIERRVMLKRYESAYGDRFVNYVNFCYDLEHWDAGTQSVARPSSAHVGSEIISPSKLQSDPFEDNATRAGPRPVPMLLRYIKMSVKRDRVRLDEYYRDFDKLRHGKITAAQFRAGLNAAGLVLSSEEMDLLGDAYACEEVDSLGKHWIAWKAFVEDVDSVFTVKGLERAPRHDLSGLQTRGEQFGGTKIELELTPEQECAVTRTVRLIKQAIDRQRLDIKPAFEDFDRSRQGYISATKFERVLSMFALLPADAVQARLLLIKFREQSAKGTGTTLSSICDVNFRAFLQALDVSLALGEEEDSPEAVVLPSSVAYRQELYSTGGTGTNAAAGRRDARDRATGLAALAPLLSELRRQLNAKRIRIKEFIVEGDKLRTGEITVAKFHTALNRSGCVVTEADVQALDQHFRSAKNGDKIDWRAFLEAVDFSHDMPTSTSAHSDPNFETVAINSPHAISEQVQRVLDRLRVEVNHRRLHMKPYFQDYDHNKIGRVTKFQFAAVLDMMKVNLSSREVQALAHQFAFRDGRATTSDVNYLTLIVAVDSDYS